MQKTGLAPVELAVKDIQEFAGEFSPATDQGVIRSHYANYLKRQQDQLRQARHARELILSKSVSPRSGHKSFHSTSPSLFQGLSTIDRERKQLETLERRKHLELQQRMAYEQELYRKQIERETKLAAKEAKVRKRKEENDSIAQFTEEKKKAALDRRLHQEGKNEQERRRRQAAEYQQDKQRLARQKEVNDEKERTSRARAEEQARRHEQFKRTTENILNAQAQRIEFKKSKLEEREFSKTAMIEAEQMRKSLEIQQAAHIRQRDIERVIQQDRTIQESIRAKVTASLESASERKSRQEAERQLNAEIQRQLDIQKQRQREGVKTRMEHLLSQRTSKILEKRQTMEQKLDEMAEQRQADLEAKRQAGYVRKRDMSMTMERGKAKLDHKRDLTLSKIESKNKRLADLAQERARIHAEKAAIRQSLDAKKMLIINEFEKKRSLGLSAPMTAGSFNSMFGNSTFSAK